MRKRRRMATLGAAAVLAITVSGCLQDPESGGGVDGLGGFADGGSADGDGVVTILGAFGGPEAELFEASLAEFEDETGIDVQYTADQDFTTTVLQRASSDTSTDISIFPQPGGVLQLAADGKIQPIDTFLDYDALDNSLIGNFLPAARLNGRTYAAPMRMAVKSLVWYDKQKYAKTGATTDPESVQDLQKSLQTNIASKGTTPWCMGWGSDAATGWVGTDWVEEYVLRVQGPEVYDQWVSHEIPFNDERIVEAFDEYAKIAKADGQVFGGVRGILATPFGETMNGAFKNDPDCYVMRQGNFISGFFPDEVQENLDDRVGIFPFPPYEGGAGDPDDGAPLLIGGDLAALMNGNDEEAIEVMRFITSPEFGGPWAEGGGWISPHRTFDAEQYRDETTRDMAEIAADAPVARYDASDSMPNEIGAVAWWSGMIDWIEGDSAEEVTTRIEEAWVELEGDTEGAVS